MLELNGFYNTGNKKTYKMSYKDGHNIREHRLVLENYLGRKLSQNEIVHHKDGNKRNNSMANLEIMTRSAHAKQHGENLRNRRKPIIQQDINGNVVRLWESGSAIRKELGYENSNICKCCKNVIKSCCGYIWRYADA